MYTPILHNQEMAMLQSMTGFSTKTALFTTSTAHQLSVTLNLKSLNSRFFESTCRLPQPFLHLEIAIIKLLKKELRRGHVYFTVTMSSGATLQGSIKPSLEIAQAYVHALQEIKSATGIESPVTLDHLIRLPNLFSVEESSVDPDIEQQLIHATQELVQELVKTRIQEGAFLLTDITTRLAFLQDEIQHIASRSQIVTLEYKKKIEAALQEINATIEINSAAEAQKNTLCAILDKIDIQEEITRFQGHLASLNTHLQSTEPEKGKRLDFILQELNREINTIASKCSDSDIGSRAISVKVELEKIREQAQNIV